MSLAFFDSNQSLVSVANATGEGGSESFSTNLAAAGDYFVRITGTANNIQFYQLSIDFEGTSGPTVDFNENGTVGCDDIDALVATIVAGSDDPSFDLTGDGMVDSADLDQWLTDAGALNNATGGAYLVGDANLDGAVDVSDFNLWNANKFQNIPAWCSADFNADGSVDVSDFNQWNANKFQASDAAAVPEPAAGLLLLLGGLIGLGFRRR